MARRYPVSLMVFGIVNLLMGGAGLIGNLGWACGIGVSYAGIRFLYQQAPPLEQRQLDELWAAARDNIPGLVVVAFILDPIVCFLLAVMQCWSGGGLIAVRNWARWMCVMWAVLRILVVLVILFYDIAYFYPGVYKFARDMDAWQQRQEERMRRAGQAPLQQNRVSANLTGNVLLDNLVPITTKVLTMIYAAVVLAWMVLPSTAQAIYRYRHPDEESLSSPERADDYYDDEYARQRRALEEPPAGPPSAR
jgi:hypothetical protein